MSKKMESVANTQITQTEDDETTLSHVRNLAYNRRASTIGEINALYYIKERLDHEDIENNVDYFNWFSVLSILIRLTYIVIFVYLIMFRQILIIILFLFLKNMFKRTREYSLIPHEDSKNVEAKVPAKYPIKNRPVIIFTAHYDSVSAVLPYKLQTFFFLFYKAISVLYVGFIGFLMGWSFLQMFSILPPSMVFTWLTIISSVVGIVISVPLLFVVFYDKPSTGSIDNASGVAVLLELAKNVKQNPLDNTDVIFLFTGAEEWGMKGSIHYTEAHFDKLNRKYDLKSSVNINIDMVGTYIGLLDETGLFKRKINYELNDILEYSAEELGIPIEKVNKLKAPQSDYKPFKTFSKKTNGNFQVACFHSDRDSKYIHSSQDSPDKCSSEIMGGCVDICFNAINILDEKYLKLKQEELRKNPTISAV
jgi:hypothetical protein